MDAFRIEAVWRGGGERRKLHREPRPTSSFSRSTTPGKTRQQVKAFTYLLTYINLLTCPSREDKSLGGSNLWFPFISFFLWISVITLYHMACVIRFEIKITAFFFVLRSNHKYFQRGFLISTLCQPSWIYGDQFDRLSCLLNGPKRRLLT